MAATKSEKRASFVCDSLDVTETLADSPFTIDWLLTALKDNDATFQTLLQRNAVAKVNAKEIGQGKGFVSRVYQVVIEFSASNDQHDVILKVPSVESIRRKLPDDEDPDAEEKRKKLAKGVNKEFEFYRTIAPQLNIPLVKMFAGVDWIEGKQSGALLMESLIGKADLCPLWSGCNLQQMFNVAKHLAALTAHFLCLPSDEWKGKFTHRMHSSPAKIGFYTQFYEKLKEMSPGVFDEGADLFEKYAKSPKFFKYTMNDVAVEAGLPLGFNHGDLWSHNLLWKLNPDGSLANELAAIIDWEICHEGSIAFDLASFIVMCVDAEERREFQYAVLQFFYDLVVKLMTEAGKSVDFTFEQLNVAYNGNCIFHTSQLMIFGPFLYSPKEWNAIEAEIKKPQMEKVLFRAKLAMDDAMELLRAIPEEKLL